eukprot:scaffold17943_cov26-Cyclotella_meneghiniana.AAC.1
MSHHGYDKQQFKVEIGIHYQQSSLQSDNLRVMAAGLFQCLIMGMINGDTRMRLEFFVHNGLYNLTLESW